MKKKWMGLAAILAAIFTMGACNIVLNDSSQVEDDSVNNSEIVNDSATDNTGETTGDNNGNGDNTGDDGDNNGNGDNTGDDGDNNGNGDNTGDDGDNNGNGDNTGDDSDNNGENQTAGFTADEKALFNEYFGFVIPFANSDEYYVEEYEEYYSEYNETEKGINYYAYGLTEVEFTSYKSLFATPNGYISDGTETDSDGDTWYYFTKGDYYIDFAYYWDGDGDYVLDVYVYGIYEDSTGGGAGDNNGGNDDNGNDDYDDNGNSGGNQSTDFTADEKALFNDYFGFVVPFAPSDEYYVEEYTYYYEDYDETEVGVNYYAYGLTSSDFTAYKALFTSANGYISDGTETDSYGDKWYYYTKNNYFVDVTYYYENYYGDYVLDVYVYDLYEGDLSGDDSGNDDYENGGNESGDIEIITNKGKGLPKDASGVYTVDFTKATNVKNVTDQGYYLDGCPTLSKDNKNPSVLVIPVEFSDVTAKKKGYTVSAINTAFNGKTGTTDYYSVSEYYYISSYGQLNVEFTVLNEWFMPKYSSSYYAKQTMNMGGYDIFIGDQLIMDEALTYLAGKMDLTKFDSDGNSVIDAVVFINTLEINGDVDFQWAYRYWNMYTDEEGYSYKYDNVSANDYMWASYQFLHESYDRNGELYYDKNLINTYTFIHEFGHILGADDYYDTEYTGSAPMGGYDVMDSGLGDHNAYTKFNYGWLTQSRLVVAEESITLTLEDFSKNGDTILLANNWDETLGAYQEYYILVYYTNNGLNSGENAGYFSDEGIVVYHVNASLYKEIYEGEVYYDVYNNNTSEKNSEGYGTKDNLIEYVQSASGSYIYGEGDSLPTNVKDDNGEYLAYSFVVNSIQGDVATITFTKK